MGKGEMMRKIFGAALVFVMIGAMLGGLANAANATGGPPPPTPKAPGSSSFPGQSIDTVTPTFQWDGVPGADYYGLYIRELNTDKLVFNSQEKGIQITGISYELPSGILENGKLYRWNMNSYNASTDWGEVSDALYFHTGACLGIDVSHWTGDINWSEVHKSGYVFAFCKATGATGFIDGKFVTNMNNGHNAHMLMGPYHFAYPEYNDAADEARHFVSVAGKYFKEGYLRPALDIEDDKNYNSYPSRLGKEKLSKWIEEWMNTVESKTGIKPILYVNREYAKNYITDSIASKYELWIAAPDVECLGKEDLGAWKEVGWAFWQYKQDLVDFVPGIPGKVDLDVFNGDISRLEDKFKIEAPPIAVTSEGYDRMQEVLDAIGRDYVTICPNSLENYDFISQFSVIFINCRWELEPIAADATESLKKYVDKGGIVYASDWAFTFLENSFPGYVGFIGYVGEGDQHVDGNVVDAGLVDYLGTNTIPLYFDLGAWVPIESVSDAVRVYVKGDVTYWEGSPTREKAAMVQSGARMALANSADGIVTEEKPIVIGFEYGSGTVIYTSFHHRAQGPMAAKLMEYLALTAMTEDLAKENKEILEGEGYEVVKDNRGMADQGETVTYTYEAAEGESFKIVLNWPGSVMKLSVYDPDGALYDEVESDTPPIGITVVKAKSPYTYQVTAVDVPYGNYEYAVGVGKVTNYPPVADAGQDRTVYVTPPATTAMVTLDGSGSYDPDGDPLSYTWTWDGNTTHGVNPTIELPLGTTTITLVVSDGELSESDTVDITVEQAIVPAVGGEAYPINKVAVLGPWLALGLAIIAGATIFIRRRRAQS